MLRPFAAGLMCLGFVTLGVAATWGQDDENSVNVEVIKDAVNVDADNAAGDVLVPGIGCPYQRRAKIRRGRIHVGAAIQQQPRRGKALKLRSHMKQRSPAQGQHAGRRRTKIQPGKSLVDQGGICVQQLGQFRDLSANHRQHRGKLMPGSSAGAKQDIDAGGQYFRRPDVGPQ